MRRLHFSLSYVGQVCIIKRPSSLVMLLVEINSKCIVYNLFIVIEAKSRKYQGVFEMKSRVKT